MTRLSVNINKVALIRNARGANLPDLVTFAKDCEAFGADGITVHPRPDQRHVRFLDIPILKEIVSTEFNIEGNPTSEFLKLVLDNKPHQCTLVPDAPNALTSDDGWDTIAHFDYLKDIVTKLKDNGIRTSLFIDPIQDRLYAAKALGADRVEFYTGPYANQYSVDKEKAIEPFSLAAQYCNDIGLEFNAGHDLNLKNLLYFSKHMPQLKEVSIGHALICDALYYGIKNTIQMYKKLLL